jgi:NAD+ kinase
MLGRIDEDRALHFQPPSAIVIAWPAARRPRRMNSGRRSPASVALASPSYGRIAFVASPIPEAQDALRKLNAAYGHAAPESADVIVALGGDGLMLQTLHRFMSWGKPIYGTHRGIVGFLMNEFHEGGLRERLAAARITLIHPLLMCAHNKAGEAKECHAFNEVSLFRVCK